MALTFKSGMEKINGSGWLIVVVVNTLTLAGIYWGIILRLDRIEARQEIQAQAMAETKVQIADKLATRQDLKTLWTQAQVQHKRMWWAINRNTTKANRVEPDDPWYPIGWEAERR